MGKFDDFFEHLSESRLLAKRKMDKYEKEKLCKKIKTAIKENKIKILERDKNTIFMKKVKLTEATALNLIKEKLTPKDILACVGNLTDINSETKIDNFLYIGHILVKEFGKNSNIYLKFQELKNDRISVVSFHETNEQMYVDMSFTDNPRERDDSFMMLLTDRLKETYNNHPKNTNKIVNTSLENRYTLFFELENEVNGFKERENLAFALKKSIPSDMGVNIDMTLKTLYVDGKIFSLDFRLESYESREKRKNSYRK